MGYIDREETPLNCGGHYVLVNQMSERERRISELVEVGDVYKRHLVHQNTPPPAIERGLFSINIAHARVDFFTIEIFLQLDPRDIGSPTDQCRTSNAGENGVR